MFPWFHDFLIEGVDHSNKELGEWGICIVWRNLNSIFCSVTFQSAYSVRPCVELSFLFCFYSQSSFKKWRTSLVVHFVLIRHTCILINHFQTLSWSWRSFLHWQTVRTTREENNDILPELDSKSHCPLLLFLVCVVVGEKSPSQEKRDPFLERGMQRSEPILTVSFGITHLSVLMFHFQTSHRNFLLLDLTTNSLCS